MDRVVPIRLLATLALCAVVLAPQGVKPTSASQEKVDTVTLPAGAVFDLSLPARTRLHGKGQRIEARLVEAFYADNRVALPAGTVFVGHVSQVKGPRWDARVESGLGGDFSPAPKVEVEFDGLRLSDGSEFAMVTSKSPAGPPLRFSAAGQSSRVAGFERRVSAVYHQDEDGLESFLKQQTQWQTVKSEAVDSLPYRPTTLPAGTAYKVKLEIPLTIPCDTVAPAAAPATASLPEGLQMHARLTDTLTSKTTPWGAPVVAILDRPALNDQNQVAVPQGSRLVGSVVQVKPARRFARGGRLRFSLTQLEVPGLETKPVATELEGASTGQALTIGGEGSATPTSPSKASSMLTLGVLAVTAVSGDSDNATAMNAASGTHLRVWGTLMSMAISPARPVALGLGMAGAARTVYSRFLGRGREVEFPEGTELEIATQHAGSHGNPLPPGH